jgi:hypothetical protein
MLPAMRMVIGRVRSQAIAIRYSILNCRPVPAVTIVPAVRLDVLRDRAAQGSEGQVERFQLPDRVDGLRQHT